jgi:hypothetical protein
MDELEQAREAIADFIEKFPALGKEFSAIGTAARKGQVDFGKSIKDITKDIEKGRSSFNRVFRTIESLDDALDELSDSATDKAKRSKLLQQREELVKLAANERTKEASIAFGKNLTNGVTKLTADLTKSLQSNASGTDVSATLLNSAIDAVTGAVGGIGGFLTDVGKDLAGTKGYGAGIGSVMYAGGKAIQLSADASAKFLKFSVEVLSKELEKTQKAFNTVNASGAIFADGMAGMREASVGAGLTLQQFSKVISEQSQDLAMSGMSVAEGARMVGATGQIFEQNNGRIRTQLLNLGYGFEEQAEITATVMGNLRRAGQSVNPAVLATETQALAENMRLLASLTGDDVKAKAKTIKEENQIAAFQRQLLMTAGPTMATQINQAMAGMTEIERKAFRDRVVLNGAVINKEAAMYEATNRVAAEKGKLLYDQFLAGTFNVESVVEANAKFSEAIKAIFKENQALFVAGFATGDSALTAISKGGLDAYNQSLKFTDEAVKEAKNSVKALKDTTEPLTIGMTGATKAAQEMAVLFEKKLLPLLSTFSQTTKDINEGMASFLKYITGEGPAPGTTPSKAPGVDTYANPALFSDGKGQAMGGISTGPVSGYTEVLHGTEAVVPLPDNKTIPVSLDSSSITASLNQQTAVMSEVLRTLQKNNNLTSQIAQNSY